MGKWDSVRRLWWLLRVADAELAESLECALGRLVSRLFRAVAGAVEHLNRVRGQRDQREVVLVIALREVVELNLRSNNKAL